MIKLATGKSSIILKAVCASLILVLGAGQFGGAAIGSGGCGMKCCCQSDPSHMKSSAEMQMRSPMGCCSGGSISPCDLEGAKPADLPEMALTQGQAGLLNACGSALSVVALNDNGRQKSRNVISQTLDPKFNSPPLYLQKLSFLI